VRTLFETTGVTKGINFSQYEDIPVTCSPAGCVKPIQTFKELHLPKALEDNIKLCGYDNPTPVQKYTIPIALAEMDIMACAQTGSGKTASFLLPVICKLLRSPETEAAPMFGATYPKCIVMAPTRELAIQIHVEARKFTYLTGLRAVVLYGGADIRAQLNSLNVGGDIIVATPGRLWDVYQRNRIRFQSVRVVILDEADRMLDMGFEPQIRQIVQSRESDMPARDQRQTLMFSATFPREIQNLAQEFLSRNVAHLTVGRIGSTTGSIIQTVGWVEEQDKIASLCEVISSSNETDLTLVFVETKRSVEDVTRKLIRHGYHAVCIHGDKAQNEREAALHMFKSGQRPILIATDVASRGLDIPNVTCVVQYDLPHSIDDYVHRIGRTGRVGNEGEGISFFNAKNMPLARDLITTLSETEQVVPDFLYDAVDTAAYAHQQKQWSRRGGGGRGRGRGGGNRGGYDSGFGGGGGFGGHHQPHHHQQQGVYGGHQQHNNYFSY
jgi:ATP-dependent RNA helicase DDX3X